MESESVRTMFRFKLTTLLIAAALIGLFLGLQAHVHNKAKRFVADQLEGPGQRFVTASVSSPSLADVLFLRRRCVVTPTQTTQPALAKQFKIILTYRVHCFGETKLLDEPNPLVGR